MTIEDYKKAYPNEKVWRAKPDTIQGMIQFNEDTACNLGGPFEGNYAYYSVIDYRIFKLASRLLTEEEHRIRIRFSHHYMPRRISVNTPAATEQHLQTRLAKLVPWERKQWEKYISQEKIDFPTVENPVSLFIAGNDDTSYSKFFPTMEAAQEELELLLACQPIDMGKDLTNNGFVFTN